jgi:hypothetical protein
MRAHLLPLGDLEGFPIYFAEVKRNAENIAHFAASSALEPLIESGKVRGTSGLSNMSPLNKCRSVLDRLQQHSSTKAFEHFLML